MSEATASGESLDAPETTNTTSVTDEQLDAIRKENVRLSEEIAEQLSTKATIELENARRVELGQLLTEQARLKTTLNAAKATTEATAQVSPESDTLMSSILDGLKASSVQADQKPGLVDTNSGYEEDPANLPSAVDLARARDAMDKSDEPQADTSETSPTASTPTGADVDEKPPAVPEPDQGESSELVDSFLSPSSTQSFGDTEADDIDKEV